jgi:hypothetical protein
MTVNREVTGTQQRMAKGRGSKIQRLDNRYCQSRLERAQHRSRFGQSHAATRAASRRFRGIFFAFRRTRRTECQQSLDGSHIRSSALGHLGNSPGYTIPISKPTTGRSPLDCPDRKKAERTGFRTTLRFRAGTPPEFKTAPVAEVRNP